MDIIVKSTTRHHLRIRVEQGPSAHLGCILETEIRHETVQDDSNTQIAQQKL